MTIKEIADLSGLNYSTVRKYCKALQERGIEPAEDVVEIVQKISEMTSSGSTVEDAISSILRTPQRSEEQSFSHILLRLEAKIDRLEKENKAQADLLQVYLSKIDRLEDVVKALPPPKKNLMDRIKNFMASRIGKSG